MVRKMEDFNFVSHCFYTDRGQPRDRVNMLESLICFDFDVYKSNFSF